MGVRGGGGEALRQGGCHLRQFAHVLGAEVGPGGSRRLTLAGYLNLSSFLPLGLFAYFVFNATDSMQIGAFILFSAFIGFATLYGYKDEVKKYKLLAERLTQQAAPQQ